MSAIYQLFGNEAEGGDERTECAKYSCEIGLFYFISSPNIVESSFPQYLVLQSSMIPLYVIPEEIFAGAIGGSDEHVDSGHLVHPEAVQHLAELARVSARPQKQGHLKVVSISALAPLHSRRYDRPNHAQQQECYQQY